MGGPFLCMQGLIDLARAARSGGAMELERLLVESGRLVHALTRARLGDSLAAEAAAVDALRRAAASFANLRDLQAYPHWLYRIATRCAVDARPTADVLPLERERADAARGPVDTLVATERTEQVRAAIESLPRKLREPVYLHYVEALSYRAIADALGVGLGTVSRRLADAHARLRRQLEGNS